MIFLIYDDESSGRFDCKYNNDYVQEQITILVYFPLSFYNYIHVFALRVLVCQYIPSQ